MTRQEYEQRHLYIVKMKDKTGIGSSVTKLVSLLVTLHSPAADTGASPMAASSAPRPDESAIVGHHLEHMVVAHSQMNLKYVLGCCRNHLPNLFFPAR